jgi:hypothetical protein
MSSGAHQGRKMMRIAYLNLMLTESELKALLSAACSSPDPAIKSMGEQVSYGLAHSDPNVFFEETWTSQATASRLNEVDEAFEDALDAHV